MKQRRRAFLINKKQKAWSLGQFIAYLTTRWNWCIFGHPKFATIFSGKRIPEQCEFEIAAVPSVPSVPSVPTVLPLSLTLHSSPCFHPIASQPCDISRLRKAEDKKRPQRPEQHGVCFEHFLIDKTQKACVFCEFLKSAETQGRHFLASLTI